MFNDELFVSNQRLFFKSVYYPSLHYTSLLMNNKTKHQLWPGCVSSIRQHEYEYAALLCCEISHKILRKDNVLDQLRSL